MSAFHALSRVRRARRRKDAVRQYNRIHRVDEENSESSASARQARRDHAAAILELLHHLEGAGPVSLDDLKVKIEAFRCGDGDDSTPAAQVVRLMSVHKAKGLGFHRVYLLQPGSLPLPTTMQWGEEWEKRSEISAAFVAQTRSYADLIFLRHLPSTRGVPLDFAPLWPSNNSDDEPDGSSSDEEERHLQQTAAADAVPRGAFRQLGLVAPKPDSLSSLRISSESRESLRDAVRRAYHEQARKVHPDKAKKDIRSQIKAQRKFHAVSEARDAISRWLSEMSSTT